MVLRALLWVLGLFCAQAALADDLVVVTSANSPIAGLTRNQVRNIFLGRTATLPDGQTATPIDQPETSPLRNTFYLEVTNRTASEAKAYWARLAFTGRGMPPLEAENSDDVKKKLNSIPGAIGYINKSELDDSVKVLLVVQ